ncbi:MAG: universal stress protein [Planctomycetes bacterium]|nr:universal stress protein [Planctomycetota bacterium]
MTSSDHPHRIVVGIDAHGQAESAINVALDLTERFGATLELVHGVEPAHHLLPDLEPHDVAAARAAIETGLAASLSGARITAALEKHALVVEKSRHPAELVLRRAAEADLVVLGRHRRRGLLDLGSTARAVLSGARCPVWMQSGPVRVIRRILVPVDLSTESLAALRMARAWAGAFDAHLHVLHCFQAPELYPGDGHPMVGPTYVIDQIEHDARAEFEKVMAEQPWSGVSHTLEFVEDHPVHRILALQDSVDLVMMGSHGRTGLAAALLGNVAYSVIRDGHVPVLALRDPTRSWLIEAPGR